MEHRESFARNMYGGGCGGMAAPLPHACIWHTSSYGCLLASCAAPPSSWATEDYPSYTIFLFNLFHRYKKSFLYPILSSNDLSLSMGRGILTFVNLYLLLSSPLSLLHVLDPKEIPTRRNLQFLVIFSRNHSPKILITFFSWTSTFSGLPSCNQVVLQYIHKELVALHLQGGMRGTILLH
jgi:hypothetical protein